VFAFSLQLVQFINLAIENLFEVLELITNSVEFAQVVLESIPVVTTVANFVDYLQESLAEEYLAEYTQTLENTYACEIMCLIVSQQDCSATWQDLYEYFLQRFGAGLENIDLFDLLNYIGGGGLSGTVFVDAAFAAFCGIMYYGDRWGDITLKGIQNFWGSWSNDSNSDWEILCGSDCGWTLEQSITSQDIETWWDDTCGILETNLLRSTVCGEGFRGLIVNVTLPEDRMVNRIEIDYRYDNLGANGLGRWTVFDDENEILQQGQWNLVEMTGQDFDTFIKYIDQIETHRVKFELIGSFDEEEGGYTATNLVTLSGQGSDPFGN
jgi:hypothetical protein